MVPRREAGGSGLHIGRYRPSNEPVRVLIERHFRPRAMRHAPRRPQPPQKRLIKASSGLERVFRRPRSPTSWRPENSAKVGCLACAVCVYHCIARCVRQAFLCGFDAASGKNFDHRKAWIEKRLENLASIFAVEIASYAVMSNHLHLILRLRPDIVQAWTDQEFATRCPALPLPIRQSRALGRASGRSS